MRTSSERDVEEEEVQERLDFSATEEHARGVIGEIRKKMTSIGCQGW